VNIPTLQSIAALKRAGEYLEQWVDVIWDRAARDMMRSSTESQTRERRALTEPHEQRFDLQCHRESQGVARVQDKGIDRHSFAQRVHLPPRSVLRAWSCISRWLSRSRLHSV
jgi:hypothetical protein